MPRPTPSPAQSHFRQPENYAIIRPRQNPMQQENPIMAEKKSDKNTDKPTDKAAALKAALAQIEKSFGKGAIMKMDGSTPQEELQVISTGSLGLDLALGVGGLPRGRIVEIFGPESSGKTTLCLETIAQCQKIGGVCAFIDAENAFDPVYARKLGVKVEDLMVSQPRHRRASPRNLRYAGALRRRGHGGGGFCCRAGAQSRD